MLRTSLIVSLVITLTVVLLPVGAQGPIGPEDTLAEPSLAPAKSIFIIFCDSKPNQTIVLDSTGKWLSTVRSASINIEAGKPATVTCTMWAGQFRPTNPEIKIWHLAQLQTVPAKQFQSYIDKLQTDPNAIAREKTDTKTDEINDKIGPL